MKPVQPLNVLITSMAVLLLLSQVVFVVNFFWSLFAGRRAVANPWQANTLDWTTSSPPPHGNFDAVPVVYRGPYEYSRPDIEADWLPQNVESAASAKSA